MKTLKFLITILLASVLAFISCQDEVDVEEGENPNTNTPDSVTASNLRRASMYDGSSDDFMDDTSCSSVLFPVTATVNGQQVTLLSQSDYQLVLNILGEFNNDNDVITFQFPIMVRLSNYNEIVIANQSEFNALRDACAEAEAQGRDAISCLDINYPVTILTYSLNFDQTGRAVIQSDQQLYTFMENLEGDELFAVNYPITVELEGEGGLTVNSDSDLQSAISQCLAQEEVEQEAEEDAEEVEGILVEGAFTVESFVVQGEETATTFLDYTIEFAGDMTLRAKNTVNSAIQDVEGTYRVYSETEVLLDLDFNNSATFELLNGTWEVTNYSSSNLSLRSTTDSNITSVLTRI